MKFEETAFKNLLLIHAFNPIDNRGQFVKVFSYQTYLKNKVNFNIEEVYYSISNKNVIRGMHFQLPPKEHDKIVFVSQGEITDVCVDLRKSSNTYGEAFSVELSSENNIGIFIPKGFAHGFKVNSDTAIVHYLQSSIYSNENDFGILWNSIPYDWNIGNPIISDRDKSFIPLKEYINSKNNCF